MLSIRNLTYAYNAQTTLNFPDWKVDKNDHALILGSSGGGKTTLLHLMGGLLKPASGEVFIEGTQIGALTTTELDHFRGQHIGFVFQRPHLIQSLSVYDNIKLATFLAKKESQSTKILSLLEDLGIGELAKRKIHEISHGQAQRVAIARAVINDPDYIFGDEPTASLDDKSCEAVVKLMKRQAESRFATLVIATHDQRVKSEFKNQLNL